MFSNGPQIDRSEESSAPTIVNFCKKKVDCFFEQITPVFKIYVLSWTLACAPRSLVHEIWWESLQTDWINGAASIRRYEATTPLNHTAINRECGVDLVLASAIVASVNRMQSLQLTELRNTETPFTRYNRLSNRLNNRLDNRLNVCLHDTAGCSTGCSNGLTAGCIA